MDVTTCRQGLDCGTLRVSIGPSEILNQWLDTRMLRGQVRSPSLRVLAAHGLPRFLRLYMLGISISILIQDL